jgi:hypothetical protein
LREKTKHHDSDSQRQERKRALRKSIGLSIIGALFPDPPSLQGRTGSEMVGLAAAEGVE